MCSLCLGSSKQSLKPLRPVGRTIYVISAIMAVLIVAFLSVIVYLKVQHSKSALPQSNHASSGSISKSTQSTLQPQQQQPCFDLKQSVSEIKSCVFNQVSIFTTPDQSTPETLLSAPHNSLVGPAGYVSSLMVSLG